MSRYSFMPLLPAIFAALVGLAGCDDDSREPSCEVSVTSPNGGETWADGSTQTITWDVSASCGPTVKIELLRDSTVCLTIASGVANSGSHAWTPVARCEGQTDGYKIRVTDWNSLASDESNATFSIHDPRCELNVTWPNGGEVWEIGSSRTITWDYAGPCGSTVLIYLLWDGEVCKQIAGGEPNSGRYTWAPIAECSGSRHGFKVRVIDWLNDVSDESDGTFTIPGPACEVDVTSPNGGESWPTGSIQTITWIPRGSCDQPVRIELAREGRVCHTIADSAANSGRYVWYPVDRCWSVPDRYKVRVTDWGTGATDMSDEAFSLPTGACTMVVTSPAGGERWTAGSTQTIRWLNPGACGPTVKIELVRDGQVCRLLASGAPNNGSYTWNPAWQCTGNTEGYRIRVTDWNVGASGESAEPFSIPMGDCTILVLYPNGGETWLPDIGQTILWDKSGICGPAVKIELLRDSEVCRTIADGVANTGSYDWDPVERCSSWQDFANRIRVTDRTTGASDVSNAGFSMPGHPCVLTVTSPNGGEQWERGTGHTITWTASGDCGTSVFINLELNGEYCRQIQNSTGMDGSYPWSSVTQCNGNTDGYRVRVTDWTTMSSDKSDEPFSIPNPECSMTVTSPNGGESWHAGDSQTITWDKAGSCGPTVKIELSLNGSACQTIASGVPNSGSYTWSSLGQCVGNMNGYRIGVTDWDTRARDESDGPFSISPPPSISGMTLIPAGSFTMGSPADELGRTVDELQHQVTLSRAFYLCDHEATQLEWQTCMGWNDSYWRGDSRPVERVTWFDALEFCNVRSVLEGFEPVYLLTGATRSGYHIIQATVTVDWNADGYRLPTEAEWEYACRATSESAYCNGGISNIGCAPLDATLDEVGWYCGNSGSGGETQVVSGKQANAWDLHDMHGNVFEWCWDWYGGYAAGSAPDPTGAASGSGRIRRGGHSVSTAASCRSAARNSLPPAAFDCSQWDCPGLRLARTTR